MRPQTYPRARRRRSACPGFVYVLIIAYLVLMAGSNLDRIPLLPGLVKWVVGTVPKGPNYYDYLNVTPTVDEANLKQKRNKWMKELHPDQTRGNPMAQEIYVTAKSMFDTLLDGKKRCEYDKKNGIRGLWPVKSCRDAFPEGYREAAREAFGKGRETFENAREQAAERLKKTKKILKDHDHDKKAAKVKVSKEGLSIEEEEIDRIVEQVVQEVIVEGKRDRVVKVEGDDGATTTIVVEPVVVKRQAKKVTAAAPTTACEPAVTHTVKVEAAREGGTTSLYAVKDTLTGAIETFAYVVVWLSSSLWNAAADVGSFIAGGECA